GNLPTASSACSATICICRSFSDCANPHRIRRRKRPSARLSICFSTGYGSTGRNSRAGVHALPGVLIWTSSAHPGSLKFWNCVTDAPERIHATDPKDQYAAPDTGRTVLAFVGEVDCRDVVMRRPVVTRDPHRFLFLHTTSEEDAERLFACLSAARIHRVIQRCRVSERQRMLCARPRRRGFTPACGHRAAMSWARGLTSS